MSYRYYIIFLGFYLQSTECTIFGGCSSYQKSTIQYLFNDSCSENFGPILEKAYGRVTLKQNF